MDNGKNELITTVKKKTDSNMTTQAKILFIFKIKLLFRLCIEIRSIKDNHFNLINIDDFETSGWHNEILNTLIP